MSDTPTLRALIEQWRAQAARDRQRSYNAVTWRAIAIEREKMADELEALLSPAEGRDRHQRTEHDE